MGKIIPKVLLDFPKYWLAKFSYVLHRQVMHWLIFDTTCASSLASSSLKRSILVELETHQILACALYSNHFNHRMKQSILCYRAAHSALLAKILGQQWQDMLKDLKDSDVHGPGKDDFIFKNLKKQIMEQAKDTL